MRMEAHAPTSAAIAAVLVPALAGVQEDVEKEVRERVLEEVRWVSSRVCCVGGRLFAQNCRCGQQCAKAEVA